MRKTTKNAKDRLIKDTQRLLYFKNKNRDLEESIESLTNIELLDLLENAGAGLKVLNNICSIIDYEAESRGLI